jgi:hypothetical protein
MSAECRGGCGVELDHALIDADGAGIHPSCVAPPEPVLPILREVLARHQAGSARSRQVALGPSEAGNPCDRALAYAMHGVPRVSEESLKWAPLVGTWGHDGIARALAEENVRLGRDRFLIEQRVALPSEVIPSGTTDLYDTDSDTVIDWKFVGKTRMLHYRRHGPGEVYRIQAHLYARGWEAADFTPRTVCVVFLPRWSHLFSDGWEWAEPYDRDLADSTLARVAGIKRLGDALKLVEHGERYAYVAANPGAPIIRDGWPLGENCRYCPWHRSWHEGRGPADETGCPGLTPQ